ncbi:MAG: hypothetical protein ABIK79_12595 [Chloroflexota bacterium]|nr:hypothetical protein [Anaerolineae bacterium]
MQWFQCVSLLLDDFEEIEMDVLHPVQAVAMNRQHIAETYGGKLCLLVGIDVQSLLSFWSAKEIAAGVHEILDCFARPEGGLMLGAGNAVIPGSNARSHRVVLEQCLARGSGQAITWLPQRKKSELCAS